jgi:hypothetical protein
MHKWCLVFWFICSFCRLFFRCDFGVVEEEERKGYMFLFFVGGL